MPETTNAPTANTDAAGQEPQSAPVAGSSEATPTAPPSGDAPSVADEQLAAAEQRATAETKRAEQLQAALDAVNKALNPGGAENEQDPTQLAAVVAERDKQLADVSERLRTAQVELAAHRAAGEHGARADRLLNSRSFLDSVAGLDPDGPKFEQQLGEQIRAAVEHDPDLYRAAPSGPARGGAEFNGPPTTEQRPKSLRDAVAARLGA
ncbi:hypothetical protein [Streptomyces sp. Da 82-17]|uniref:hypothetical protein n=1 Tax=Streptomyces sp. Da 82-17 TaxID=3377116 RepID=UPI0038D4F7A5